MNLFSPALETMIQSFVASQAGSPIPPAVIEASLRTNVQKLLDGGKTEVEIIAEIQAAQDLMGTPAPAGPVTDAPVTDTAPVIGNVPTVLVVTETAQHTNLCDAPGWCE